MRRALFLLLLASLLFADEKPYGFDGMEIYKLEWKTVRLTPADLDGDGLTDLLVANNRKAKIDVLLRRKEPVPLEARRGEKLPNDLDYDRFFEKREILTEKEVFSLIAADLNGDGAIDVSYFGRPEELVVAYGDGKGNFPRSARFPAADGSTLRRGLAAADLNGDGRTDLAHVGKAFTAVYYQTEKGTLAEPRKLPHSDKGVAVLQTVDVNGDGRTDLVHMLPNDPRSVRVRFQESDGTLGPALALETTPWRIGAFGNYDGKAGSELTVIQRSSGVLRTLAITSKESSDRPLGLGDPLLYAFESTGGKKARSVAVGDVNGDGRNDVVVSEPDTAQVALYLQREDGRLASREKFPSLANIDSVRVSDLDGDKRAEVIVLSKTENTVGVASLTKEGRLPFPRLLELPGKPLAIDARPQLVVVYEKDKVRHARIGDKDVVLEGVKSGPDAVLATDFNQDGRFDLVLLDRFGKARVWLGAEEGKFAEAKSGGAAAGMLNRLDAGAVSLADVNGDQKTELLVSSKNFARALRLGAGGSPEVVDQANGASPRSQVKGAVAADFDGDGKPEIALFDRDGNRVTLLKRGKTGVFGVVGNIPVGTLEFRSMHATDLNGDGRSDLLLAGRTRFAVLHAQGRSHELTERHTYERREEFSSLGYFGHGDLNGNGGVDLAVIDRGKRSLVIVSYDASRGFVERLVWPVYEKKMHENEKQGGGAREIAVADFDGDGKDDIAVLIHDRVIVYRQG
ncbi:MAG: FG-GAP repeat domain-containing protein [Planctomycetota bacterium]|jgi:hypothetical protein